MFCRVKGAKGLYPRSAARYCLQEAGITLDDVTEVAVGWDVLKYRTFMPSFYANLEMLHDKGWETREDEAILVRRHSPDRVRQHYRRFLWSLDAGERIPPVQFHNHHLCHAVSAFYNSGYDQALILVIDGSGEENCTTIWMGDGLEIEPVNAFTIPNSLGWFYSSFTEYLGFQPNRDEGKVMGLAAYGKFRSSYASVMQDIVRTVHQGFGYRVDPTYIFYGERSYGARFTEKLVHVLGAPRRANEEITERHADIAWAVQERLDAVVTDLVNSYAAFHGISRVCLAGGVGMNCVLNRAISNARCIQEVFVQPVSHDAGTALGAAQLSAVSHGSDPRSTVRHLFLGPGFSEEDIGKTLKDASIPFSKITGSVSEVGAEILHSGRTLGWFQGRVEVGGRALGNRSILADPRSERFRELVNSKVKLREPWRPLASSVLEEEAAKYFVDTLSINAPFMSVASGVVPGAKDLIPAVVHVDGTARPHTVHRDTNRKYWELISNFQELTGIPVVLNTSFNVRGEPLVCTPTDAIRVFMSCGLDAMIIGDFLVEKSGDYGGLLS